MKQDTIFAAFLIIAMLLILIVWTPTAPDIQVQPEKPTREYIRKYPVADQPGEFLHVLVREYVLDVEFVDTISGGEDD